MITPVLALTCFAAYGIALRLFFGRPDGVQPGMRLIQLLGVPLSLVHVGALILAPADSWAARQVGTAMYAASLLLFLWTWRTARAETELPLAFSRSVPGHVLETGPYRFMRHPFYTAYVMTWAAGAVYCLDVALLSTALLFLAIYSIAIAKEEMLLLAGPAGLAYAAYRCRTGCLWPRTRLGSLLTRPAVLLACGVIAAGGSLAVLAFRYGTGQLRGRPGSAIAWGPGWNHAICRLGLLVSNVAVRRDRPIAPDRPALIASNHVSWLDALVLGAQGRFVFVAAREFEQNVLALILRSFGTIFIDRARPRELPEFCTQVRQVLCAGHSVVVFPEGTTTDGTFIGPFHASIFEAALEAGVPVVPVGISYDSADPRLETSKDVAWTAGSLVRHSYRFLMGISPVRATVAVGVPIEPWVRTRMELAHEARTRCAALARVPCRTDRAIRSDETGSHPALPEWLLRAVGTLHDAGLLACPVDPSWHSRTRIADTGLDSLSVLVLEEELTSLGYQCAPWHEGITFGEWLPLSEGTGREPRAYSRFSISRCVNGHLVRVGDLRYRVYAAELKRPFPSADLLKRVLLDPLDHTGVVLACEDGPILAATCRLNWAPDEETWRVFERPLQLAELARRHGRDRIAIASKLVVDRPYRRNPMVISLLLTAVLREAEARGAGVLVAHTRGTLTSVMARAGFHPYGSPYFDRDWGSWQHPIAADVRALLRTGERQIALGHASTPGRDNGSFAQARASGTT